MKPKHFPNLKAWRVANGLTQIDAAAKLGLTQSAYSKLERQVYIPIGRKVKRYAELTGVSADVLVGAA